MTRTERVDLLPWAPGEERAACWRQIQAFVTLRRDLWSGGCIFRAKKEGMKRGSRVVGRERNVTGDSDVTDLLKPV
jgi:hypothetical protein